MSRCNVTNRNDNLLCLAYFVGKSKHQFSIISQYCVFILYWNPTLIQCLSGRVSLFDDDIRCGLLSVECWGLVMSTLVSFYMLTSLLVPYL